ncbi:uncharacterized protein N7477_001911 [Penicillium maclennaniae]|uniref:uncharacterized protein n=1 Tax=Penicillium maclennaniae TaxID=1343394 RepID=UPI0025415C31|nr:uncharacterized protein N7477_001911 [Penicillium maclennaniae]KAJ5681971.1 hypothetical protein N7477_001911 [Penicillium maclennaniae]
MTTTVRPSTDTPLDKRKVSSQTGLSNRDGMDPDDGRLDIDLSKTSLEGLFARFKPSSTSQSRQDPTEQATTARTGQEEEEPCPVHLNIVIQVVGSRGDIQPFIVIGKALKQYGHRVRLATHLTFRNPVKENGLEFFDIGGHPAELMTFMVENTGLLPQFKTIRSGAVQRRRRDMGEIIQGCWRSCFETGDGTHLHQIPDILVNGVVGGRQRPFVADAIIANPPSFAHIHCAEKLGIPLTIMFTMPWSPTQAFPHPLASIKQHDTKPTVANAASYAIVDMIHWQGLGDIINRFRRKSLNLDTLDAAQAQGVVQRLHIPHAYLWSPALLSKPKDWPDNIDVCGFTFLSSASDYKPPEDLLAFLKAGPPPVYVGFGSIVVDNPQALSKIIRGAVQKAGQRAIISKGWGGLGTDGLDSQKGTFLLGNCPHDWLFQHVSCVVHHGGAGTTATGLKFGRPTVIVPFFGDQPFWGDIIARDGVGPSPIPYKDLTVEKLADAILEALKPASKQKAHEISEIIQRESGVENAVSSFHRHLPYERMRCALCPSRPAVWCLEESKLALSAFATTVLVEAELLDPNTLKLYRSEEYDTSRDPQNPLSAGSQVVFGSLTKLMIDMRDTSSKWSLGEGTVVVLMESAIACQRTGHKRDQSFSTEGKKAKRAGTLPVSKNDWNQARRGSSSGRPQRKGRKGSISTFENCLPTTAAHASRLAQGILDMIVIPPMEISLTISKGFRNAPLFFHDDTVRDSPTVTGIRSGLGAAGTEFTSGIFDGVSGLITQPRRGLKKAGGKGLIQGIQIGFVGFMSKPLAGLFGIAAYPLTGLHRHLRDSLSDKGQGYIKRSRIAQGLEEFQASSFDERADVIGRWSALGLAGAKRKK